MSKVIHIFIRTMLEYKELEVSDYVRVVHVKEKKSGLDAIIALHNINRGPAAGGTRLLGYKNFKDQLRDVLKLSKAMSYKNAFAQLSYGGGKANINKNKIKRLPEALKYYAEAINKLDGDFYTGGDINVGQNELRILSSISPYVDQADVPGDYYTARGILFSIVSAWKHITGESIQDTQITLQGLGKVGNNLAKMLDDYEAKISASELDKNKHSMLYSVLKYKKVDNNDVLYNHCDILAPCAVGNVITEYNVSKLNCKLICGGANNIVSNNKPINYMHKKGIVFVPDYVSNAGGVISTMLTIEKQEDKIEDAVYRIYDDTKTVLEISKEENISPLQVANRISEERMNVA